MASGHRYLTVVMDLDSGAVVFVGDGKGADALKPFWKRLRPSGAQIEAVAMDMSAAFRSAVPIHLPKVVIVFDHFHLVKLFNEKLTDLRRALIASAMTLGATRSSRKSRTSTQEGGRRPFQARAEGCRAGRSCIFR